MLSSVLVMTEPRLHQSSFLLFLVRYRVSHRKEIIVLVLVTRLFEGDRCSLSLFSGMRHLPHQERVTLPERVLEFVFELHGRLLEQTRRDIIPMTRGQLTFIQFPVGQGVYFSLDRWHVLGNVATYHAVPHC